MEFYFRFNSIQNYDSKHMTHFFEGVPTEKELTKSETLLPQIGDVVAVNGEMLHIEVTSIVRKKSYINCPYVNLMVKSVSFVNELHPTVKVERVYDPYISLAEAYKNEVKIAEQQGIMEDELHIFDFELAHDPCTGEPR